VPLFDLTFLNEIARYAAGTSNRRHYLSSAVDHLVLG
jgi:hypothetical protein